MYMNDVKQSFVEKIYSHDRRNTFVLKYYYHQQIRSIYAIFSFLPYFSLLWGLEMIVLSVHFYMDYMKAGSFFPLTLCRVWRMPMGGKITGINLGMDSANERRHYIVMASLIGWAHTQNDPYFTCWFITVFHDQHPEMFERVENVKSGQGGVSKTLMSS